MTGRNGFVERRKHERFKVKNCAIVGVSDTKSGYACLGRFINISKGGLAFRYDDRKVESTGAFKIDILSVQDSFYLYDIPVKTVWVSHACSNLSSSFSKTSKQGVQFVEMTPPQTSLLDAFIQKYTIR